MRKIQEEVIRISTETIRLSQLLKLANVVESGIEAKLVIQDGAVSVNGEVEMRRGRKLRDGDRVTFLDHLLLVSD